MGGRDGTVREETSYGETLPAPNLSVPDLEGWGDSGLATDDSSGRVRVARGARRDSGFWVQGEGTAL